MKELIESSRVLLIAFDQLTSDALGKPNVWNRAAIASTRCSWLSHAHRSPIRGDRSDNREEPCHAF